MNRKIILSPSLMCMDLMNMAHQIQVLEDYSGMFHADVMDGHFAPNLTLSPDFVKAVKGVTQLPVDAHLMVERPNDFIDAFITAGADYITVHAETIQNDAFRTLTRIKVAGKKVGVAICPATPLSTIAHYAGLIDLLLIMTVDVGYAGQVFINPMLEKLAEANELRKSEKYNFLIQVDGSIGKPVYRQLYDSGADVYVMGTSGLFKKGVPLKNACEFMAKDFLDEIGVDIK